MPELPDLTVYLRALRARIVGARLEAIRIRSPFLLRTVEPPIGDATGSVVESVSLIGKRIVFGLEGDRHLVIHLMIAGRLRWRAEGASVPKPNGLAAFDFGAPPSADDGGTLVLTEASKKKRASLHFVEGAALLQFDRGGLDPLTVEPDAFLERLQRENRTLKRALTDPRIFAGIGNAYSDEILHRAGLSPVQRTRNVDAETAERLRRAVVEVVVEWTDRLAAELGDGFPDKVTAFRPEMAVHGRFRQPCPVCGAAVQRIRFGDNEMNYCPRCQTDGKLLADRSLSRLLKGDWPKTLDELEARLGKD